MEQYYDARFRTPAAIDRVTQLSSVGQAYGLCIAREEVIVQRGETSFL
jgi:hypothetical protein